MTSLKNNLSSLKSKLKDIETQLDVQITAKAISESKQKNLNEKMVEIENNQNQQVTLNIGGKKFTTSKQNLMKDPQSIFYILLTEDYPDISTLPNNELYFDRSPQVFPIILHYLRYGKIDYKKFDKITLQKIYEEAEFYEVSDIRQFLYERTRPVDVISFTFSGEYIYKDKVAGTNTIIGLKDKSQNQGICSKSPGWIIFELNSTYDFDKINIGGYKGDAKTWYSGNGSGAKILVSEDGKEFKKVGTIPSKYANQIAEVKLDKKVTAKWVKFEHTSYLGIGYFHIDKIDDE